MDPKLSEPVDVIVIGAGPAGLAAATQAGGQGARVVLIDAGSVAGGQYWRQRETAVSASAKAMDRSADSPGYGEVMALLREQQRRGRTLHLSDHHVWTVERHDDRFIVHVVAGSSPGGQVETVPGRRLVLAPGAHDRQIPFPGWDLPGVMAAGGVQGLLKGHGVVAGQRIVVAGTGPFLLPVAAGLLRAGATVIGVHEAAPSWSWMRHARAVARNVSKVGEGLGYVTTLARRRTPYRTGSVLIAAHGRDQIESVTVRAARSGRQTRLECDTVAVGWGFTPRVELALTLGCAVRLDVDGSTVVQADDSQESTVPGVYVAGEICGVGGASLAVVEGKIAGAAAAGTLKLDNRTRRHRTALRDFAAAIHDVHPVPTGWASRIQPTTVVCRCEEVTVGDLNRAVDHLGASDARSAKLLTRAGMGWCQGRICSYGVGCLLAERTDGAPTTGTFGPAGLITPLTLGRVGASRHTLGSLGD